jgi:miniconductance mechanosensitive channel
MVERLTAWLGGIGWLRDLPWGDTESGAGVAALFAWAIAIALLVLVSLTANFIAKKLIVRVVHKIVLRTDTTKDDIFVTRKVFTKLSHMAPALVIYLLAETLFGPHGAGTFTNFCQSAALLYMLVVGILVVDSVLSACLDVYETFDVARDIPLKGLFQVAKIVTYFLGSVLAVSIVMAKSPAVLLGGLGALTAIIMLIFKDSILGFVAGIQLTTNRMLKRGDWIEMPSHGADGDVIDIALTTVKVQNWDKTITTIPTYALISGSFKNWRGMDEAGGRRIKRALSIDMTSLRFCDEEMLARFRKIAFINEYIERKLEEITAHNDAQQVDTSTLVNGRRLTNLGTFRAYVEAYLENHPLIHPDMTLMVRQLTPTERGVPIEIYCFSTDKVWKNYEGIQADIFDHLLAILGEFDLRVFQYPCEETRGLLARD